MSQRKVVKLKMSIQLGDEGIPFIDLGDGYKIRLEYEDLQEEKYIEKARTELRETPEVVKAAVEELRELIKGRHFTGFEHKSFEFAYLHFISFEAIGVSLKNFD